MFTATTTTSGTQMTEWGRRLLAAEGALGNGAATAIAAGRVYDKLNDQLVPLLGVGGVRALFTRSAKLAQTRSPGFCESGDFERALSRRANLGTIELVAPRGTAENVFATFISLMPTFIGERLTRDALSRAWPYLGEQ